jgi:hypothetical protein
MQADETGRPRMMRLIVPDKVPGSALRACVLVAWAVRVYRRTHSLTVGDGGGNILAGKVTALTSAQAIAAALVQRYRTGTHSRRYPHASQHPKLRCRPP